MLVGLLERLAFNGPKIDFEPYDHLNERKKIFKEETAPFYDEEF